MIYKNKADAKALIQGGDHFPQICGEVLFYQTDCAVIVRASICRLPDTASGFFAFHIHEGDSCSGEGFSETKGHDNPCKQPHPRHAGDMPPLLSCDGTAYIEFRTNRFCVKDVIGKTVVIHGGTDDFQTQPSGNAGERIACGTICRV